jgi:hypothetical protein
VLEPGASGQQQEGRDEEGRGLPNAYRAPCTLREGGRYSSPGFVRPRKVSAAMPNRFIHR